jgi:hypothetical protein
MNATTTKVCEQCQEPAVDGYDIAAEYPPRRRGKPVHVCADCECEYRDAEREAAAMDHEHRAVFGDDNDR